tara:strand:+ start:4799 stop:5545 length:747 start_codon:yes stop_codon:yes gene_type:complete
VSSVLEYLMNVRDEKGAGYLVLIDPDRKNDGIVERLVQSVNESEVDAILAGGSLFMDGKFHERVALIKEISQVPVILFPGAVNQLGPHFDAVLFMSIISGRNPTYLIGEQVIGAPIVRDLGLEAIATGYMLFDGGGKSTVEFLSNTQPLPMERSDLAVAHGLAAQYLGMKLLYLEAGSGAVRSIPEKIISALSSEVELPIIVGGGIKSPEEAAGKVEAGASFVVTGTVTETDDHKALMQSFADAVHGK